MLTIFDGPDCGGKSTAISQLTTGSKDVIVHHDHMPDKVGVGSLFPVYVKDIFNAKKHNTFMDRCWWSEYVYSKVVREGEDRTGLHAYRILERIALSYQGVLVLTLPRLTKLRSDFMGRIDEEYVQNPHLIDKLYARYVSVLARTHLPGVVYDYELTSVDQLQGKIEEVRPLPNAGPGIGNWNPGKVTLIVGDSVNPNNYPPLPFAANKGSSYWLAQRLDEWCVSERDLYWINARNLQGGYTNPKFLEELQPSRVIAMGNNAGYWCRSIAKLGYVIQVPHPSYWKRFKSGQEYYALRDALGVL